MVARRLIGYILIVLANFADSLFEVWVDTCSTTILMALWHAATIIPNTSIQIIVSFLIVLIHLLILVILIILTILIILIILISLLILIFLIIPCPELKMLNAHHLASGAGAHARLGRAAGTGFELECAICPAVRLMSFYIATLLI